MRKFLLGLVIIGATIGVTAPTAGATASCSFGQNANVRSGSHIYYAASVYNCTDVSIVKWVYHPAGNPYVGWYDWTLGGWAQGGLGLNTTSWGSGDVSLGGPCVTACVAYVHQTLWYTGQCRDLQGRWYVTVYETSTNKWTSLVTTVNAHYTECN